MAALAAAILRGSIKPEYLDELLGRGSESADLQYVDPVGRRLVHIAAGAADIVALRWLIAKGADVQAQTRDGETALHVAASEGSLDVVKFLVEEAGVGVEGLSQATWDAAAGHPAVLHALTSSLQPPIPPPPATSTISSELTKRFGARFGSICNPTHSNGASPRDADQGDEAWKQESHPTKSAGVPNEEVSGDAKRKPRELECANERWSGGKARCGDPASPDSRRMTKGGFYVSGAWSKAGVCSCFHVQHKHLLGKHGIVFDIGVCPGQVVHAGHVFITHGHHDHCGAAMAHARLRCMGGGRPPARYYVPAGLAPGLQKVKEAFEEIEGDKIHMDIVAVAPGSAVDLGQGCFVRPFSVKHRVESLGYALIRRKTNGLK
ncbi:unnamed protein product, partial [Discosporangium mesarthrocarpum]